MRSNLRDVLRQFPLFQMLSEERLQEVTEYAILRKYNRGQLIFIEGDPRTRIYFLINGYVRLVIMDDEEENASEFTIYLRPYSLFPYVGLFQDEYYRFSAEAVTDAVLASFPVDRFEQLIRDDPQVLVQLVRIMGEKMHELEIRSQKLIRNPATDRIRNLIGLLIKDLGEAANGSSVRIPCPLTANDLAKMAGTSRETVTHVLKGYKESGKLLMKSRTITINDPSFFTL